MVCLPALTVMKLPYRILVLDDDEAALVGIVELLRESGYVVAAAETYDSAKRLLASKGQTWTEIDLEASSARRTEMIERGGRRTVPQIWIGGEHVGGSDELHALERAGGLDPLLAKAS